MAKRVWKKVLVDHLYEGDTVSGYGLIKDMWTEQEEEDTSCCGDEECCGPVYRTLTYGLRFEGQVKPEFWQYSKEVYAFVE